MTSSRRTVSMIDIAEQNKALRADLDAAFARVLDSARFVGGDEIDALERELAAHTGSRHNVSCGSGTDALVLALLAHGVGPGDRVVVPAFTFFASAGAVALIGAVPIFVDIDPITLCLDQEAAASTIETQEIAGAPIRAVVAVHLYGRPAALDRLAGLCGTRGIALIEDAAQALGARDHQGHAIGGAQGSACFSFYPTKNLGALGEAGLVSCDDEGLAERLRRIRNHGASETYRHPELGWNARMDAIQAAFLRVKLRHLEDWNDTRRANARDYDERFGAAGATRAGETPPRHLPLCLPASLDAPARTSLHQYVIRVPAETREGLRHHLSEHGIASAVYYPRGLHQEDAFCETAAQAPSLPVTERVAHEVLALPSHPSLNAADREHVVDAVLSFYRSGDRSRLAQRSPPT